MIQTLVATLMWALVASLLIFRRKRTDRSITRAAFTIAIAMAWGLRTGSKDPFSTSDINQCIYE